MPSCGYCSGPITGAGHTGRPWPGRAAADYCCFGCLSLGEQRRQESAARQSPADPGRKLGGLGLRLGFGILVVGQSMIFGLALNLHDDVPANVRWTVQTIILGATVLVLALLGGALVRSAWHELRRGRLTLEALFLLTMAGALVASLQAHFTGHGKIYFEVVSVLLVVYTLGKLIGARSRAAALAGSRAWAGQLDSCRIVDAHGRTRTLPVSEIVPGDHVEVHPGETIAIDGVIRAGTGFVSEAAVSGEPFAVVRRPGDRVLAGSASHDAAFRIEATAPGTARQVDRLLAAVAEARDRPVSMQAQAERIGRWFFPLVVLTALGTFGYWTFLTTDGWEAGLFNAMSVLLVACPCVIGLATPIIIWSTVGRLAERGLIVRTGDAIERLAGVDRIMLDKTGTLTDDRFVLIDIATAATGDERAELLGWLSVIQERSAHPVARPFAQLPRPFAPDKEPRVTTLRAIPGSGVEAEIETRGERHVLRIGTDQWVSSHIGLEPKVRARAAALASGARPAEEVQAEGHTVHVARDGELVAVAVLAERLRDSAGAALADFHRLGLPVEVLTGDTAARAAALGLTGARAGMLPDDKRAAVETGGKVLFVGDGINDAAALAAAHVGIALASGTDLAVGASAVTLYHGDLRVLPWAIELARAAARAVRRNLYRALFYNLIGMTLAACGFLHPVAAAVLMVVSSLSLIFSATRVGVTPDHCDSPASREPVQVDESPAGRARARPDHTPPLPFRAAVHGIALALQGAAFLLLLGSARELLVAVLLVSGFTLAGIALACFWHRWESIPHWLDMIVGMLTLGNLGMLIGWWVDNDCAALAGGGCCQCVESMRSGVMLTGMWVGMLVLANAAMVWFGRRSLPRGGHHVAAMFTGGNVGMAAGMIGGGWCAARLATESMGVGVAASFVGMTAGMIAGMLFGTWLTERLLAAIRFVPALPGWLRGPSALR